MKFAAVLFLFGLVAISSALPRTFRKVPGGGRIVGGAPATPGQLPYQISLLYGGRHICGGSIIAQNVVVTAAHCVEGDSPRDLQIVAGEHDRSQTSGNEQTIQVVRIAVHEQYDVPTQFANDIALLFLSTTNPLVFDDFSRPVALPTQEQQTSVDIIVSGWGTTSQGGSLPNILQWVQLPIVSDETCRMNYAGETILDSMLCAGFPQGGRDSCQGDSGGPLVTVGANNYLAGVVSWGYGCAQPNYPGVNTEVSYFVNWINDKIMNQ